MVFWLKSQFKLKHQHWLPSFISRCSCVMEPGRPMTLACAAACLTAAPLFVVPAGNSAPSLRGQSSGLKQEVSARSAWFNASSAPMCASFAFSGAALMAVNASKRTNRRSQIMRRVATLDAAEELETAPAPPPFNPADQIGAMAPLGYFDPLGFTKVGDEEGFNNLRASELKHGRVAMMASVGLVGQHFIKFPGFEKTPAGFAAIGTGEGALGFIALAMSMSILELAWRQEEGREPGNFGDPFGVNMYTEEMRSKEISNGRFAMICVVGIIAAELASGKDAIQQFGF